MNTDRIYAERLASEYTPKTTGKVAALRKLDRKAKAPANIFAYTCGIVSCLLLGTGMCLDMDVIGGGSLEMHIAGLVLGVIGIVGMSVTYPIYKRILENGKKKYAGDIVALAKEISEE